MNEKLKKIIFAELISLIFLIVLGFIIAYYAPTRLGRYIAVSATFFLLYFVDSYYWYVVSNKWPNRRKIIDIAAFLSISAFIVGAMYLILTHFYPEYACQYVDKIGPMALAYALVRIFLGRPKVQW